MEKLIDFIKSRINELHQEEFKKHGELYSEKRRERTPVEISYFHKGSDYRQKLIKCKYNIFCNKNKIEKNFDKIAEEFNSRLKKIDDDFDEQVQCNKVWYNAKITELELILEKIEETNYNKLSTEGKVLKWFEKKGFKLEDYWNGGFFIKLSEETKFIGFADDSLFIQNEKENISHKIQFKDVSKFITDKELSKSYDDFYSKIVKEVKQ
jgi:hypothetical protein